MENMIGQIFCENKVFLLTQDNYGRSAVILDGKREEFLLSPKIKQLKEILCQHLNLHLLSGYGFCENGSAEKLCYGYRLALDFFRFRSIYSQDINVFQTKLPDITLLDSLNLLNTQVKTHLFNRQNQNLQQALHDMKDDLSLNSIASELLISPSYLSRNFTKLQGTSLTSYLTCTRLENARRLLSDTDLSIAEISAKSGYRDLFYFSKRFKSCFGVSPSRYRTEFQAGESDRKH